MPLSHTIDIRLFGILGDFVAPLRRSRRFEYSVKGCPSVKDTLEAIGVPHVAVDVIIVNGKSRDFLYQIKEGDDLQVYPEGYLEDADLVHLVKAPVKIHFIADSHLGKLARDLRLLGFSVLYRNIFPDPLIVRLAALQQRIVLTRDKGLLKHRSLRWGYWVRSIDHKLQVREVLKRYDLIKRIIPFSRCVECNGPIKAVAKARIMDQLPPLTRKYFQSFTRCQKCRKIYWKGFHYRRLMLFVRQFKRQRRHKLNKLRKITV
jgi:uncharacterized protein with PIN domain